MTRSTLLLYLMVTFTIVMVSNAQEVILEKAIDLQKSSELKEVLPITSPNQDPTLVLMDRWGIHILEFDEHLNEKAMKTFDRPHYFHQILGYSVNNGNYIIYFGNHDKTKIASQKLNVATGLNAWEELPLNLKNERIGGYITHGKSCYVFTAQKGISNINMYVFQDGKFVTKKAFDVAEEWLSGAINSMVKIDLNSPTSLEQASKDFKLYSIEGKAYLTFDNNVDHTKVITIDLDHMTHKIDFFKHQLPECKKGVSKTNSFLTDGTIYQIQSCNTVLSFQSRDLSSKSQLSTYTASLDTGIPFKNGIIAEKSPTNTRVRELTDLKQFFKRIAKNQVGLSSYLHNDLMVLTIGGNIKIRSGLAGGGIITSAPGGTMMTPGGPVSMPPIVSYNPVGYGYGQYVNTKSIYFNTILDKDSHMHLQGAVEKNVFDKIEHFEKTSNRIFHQKTVFQHGNQFVFGYFNRGEKVLVLRSFSE